MKKQLICKPIELPADCLKYRAKELPEDWPPESSTYFRELAKGILCEIPLPPDINILGEREIGILIWPNETKTAINEAPIPAITVQAAFLNPLRLLPGFSAISANGNVYYCGRNNEKTDPLDELHVWLGLLAGYILFSLDHPERSNLALSMISSQPGG